MASINSLSKTAPVFTHNNARGFAGTPYQQLLRTVMCCMLWEDQFYEDGVSVAERIKQLVHHLTLAEVSQIAIAARNEMKLRHVPLLIVREMARHPKRVHANHGPDAYANHTSWISRTLAEVIQRPDELSEFLALYWKDGKQPLSKQVKLGLAKAFQKFNEYQLAKYNRKKDIMLRDVLFLCHSKPADVPISAEHWDKTFRAKHAEFVSKNADGAARFLNKIRPEGFTQGELLYGKLVYDQLQTPDTWEVELSQSKDKYASWHRLLTEGALGDLAFLRNLRNMLNAGIDAAAIKMYGDSRKWGRVLPFRFVAAARMVPQLEPMLEGWMLKCLEGQPKLPGKTVFLTDVSGSMFNTRISAKSDMDRFDAAAALTILGRELCEDVRVFTFSNRLVEVPARRGFALRDALSASQPHQYTYLGQALADLQAAVDYDRVIVLTDEQSNDKVITDTPGYIINVAAYENGVATTGRLMRISGWSEAVFDYITMLERTGA